MPLLYLHYVTYNRPNENHSFFKKFKGVILFLILAFITDLSFGQTKQLLPRWKKGELDIYQISYGLGNSCYCIFPDGTTLLIDAGAINEDYPREVPPIAHPNSDKSAGTHIVDFIKGVMPQINHQIDYALITHFHDDHMGFPGKLNKWSGNGKYRLTGITEVGESILIKKILDRGWPDYKYPRKLNNEMVENYWNFILDKQATTGLKMEKFQTGTKNQIKLLKEYKKYNSLFSVRNIISNGVLWTGIGSKVHALFPDTIPTNITDQLLENACSNAIKINYGKFSYFNGGDIEGIVMQGIPGWLDMETPVSKVVGKVDVQVVDHHGYKNSENDTLLNRIKPTVFIVPAWASVHPDSSVLKRIIAENKNTALPYIFTTSLLNENKEINKSFWPKLSFNEGHILIRVEKGGKKFNVFIIDDQNSLYLIKAKYGPFVSK